MKLDVAQIVTYGAAGAVVLAFLLVLILSLRPRRPKRLSTRQYNAELFKRRMALEELPHAVLHDVRLKDTKGGIIAIDQVIRLPASVLLITSAPQDVGGQVMASPSAGQWKYVNGQGAVSVMLNPVVQLHPLIHAIRARYPLVKVRLLTVFPASADFRGKPPRGCCLGDGVVPAVKEFAAEDGVESPVIEQAWESLSTSLQKATAEAKA